MNASPPNPLRRLFPLAGRALQAALRRALALDPATQQRLQPLTGQAIELHLESPTLALRIELKEEGLCVGPADPERDADLSLRATAGALLDRALSRGGGVGKPAGRLKISGDAELAQQLQRLAQGFDPDFDAAFAEVFGEIIGPQISKALATGLRGARGHARQFAEDAVDYLVEERRDVVSGAEQAQFFEEVDALRDAVDRLEARVRRLASGSVP